MTQCTASSSGSFKPLPKIRNAVNFSPCTQHRKVEWTRYYVKAEGQIWTSDRDMGGKTEPRLCTVLTLLIATLSIPAESLLTWAQPCNRNVDSLPERHSYSLLFQPPTPLPVAAFLLSLSQQTQPVRPHSKTARKTGNKNQEKH